MKKVSFFQLLLLFFVFAPVFGQGNDSITLVSLPDTSDTSFRLFEDKELLEITLRFDLKAYFKSEANNHYLKARITFHLSETDSIRKKIRLKRRGEFRNNYCVYPPIELNFKKADFGYSDLNNIADLKMVPQCRSGSENQNYVLREFLVYKLFNELTDTSFRVRLLTVNFIDSEKKRKPFTQYCFFIEPLDMLTARTNAVQIKTSAITQKSIVPEVMDRLAIFNYMIGNYDWAIPGQHNVKVIKHLNIFPPSLGIAIPYDFDWTGLVNTAYAIPAENVGTQNVRERIFLGICRSKETYLKTLEIFKVKKEAFYRIINEFPYLDQKEKKDMIFYLDTFYNELIGKRDITVDLLNSCKDF